MAMNRGFKASKAVSIIFDEEDAGEISEDEESNDDLNFDSENEVSDDVDEVDDDEIKDDLPTSISSEKNPTLDKDPVCYIDQSNVNDSINDFINYQFEQQRFLYTKNI